MHRRSGIGVVTEQHRRREHAEARIDADEEIDRADIALDGAELHALDLGRDRPKLARRVDLHLDTAVGSLLDLLLVELDELVLGLIDRRGAEFQDEVGGGRRNGQRDRAERQGGGERQAFAGAEIPLFVQTLIPPSVSNPARLFGRFDARAFAAPTIKQPGALPSVGRGGLVSRLTNGRDDASRLLRGASKIRLMHCRSAGRLTDRACGPSAPCPGRRRSRSWCR